MTPDIFKKLKTRPTIVIHVDSINVQGEFILQRINDEQKSYERLCYNFNVRDLEDVALSLEKLLEYYELQGFVV